jgi:hypothetical protein
MTTGALLLCAAFSPAAESQAVHIHLDGPLSVERISEDFIGFGYETSAVAQKDFFSARNERMIRLYRNLGCRGLIRIGGNVSDHTRFEPNGASAPKTEQGVTIINQADLDQLGEFARATGWRVMWGLNLGTGTREEAVEEAVAVDRALGDRVHSFEIGNEVDLMPKYAKDYDAYHAAYLDFKTAIRARLPHATFSGPDVAGNMAFVDKFIATESADMSLATHHYYRTGARNKNATIEHLLKHDDGFASRLDHLRDVCAAHHLDYRINEVNSFYGGGKEGVSDTFASALWCLDYAFDLAAHGCRGVNVETDINQHGFVSFYSPIAHDTAGVCSARPEYYALLAFATAGHGMLLKASLDATDLNLSVYATRDEHGVVFVTAINKDLARDADLTCPLPEGCTNGTAYALRAPSVDAKSGVTFAGTSVSEDGTWTPGAPESVHITDGAARFTVPHASALVVKFTK